MSNLLRELYDTPLSVKEIVEEAKSKIGGIAKYLNPKCVVTNLPEICEIGIERIGNYFVRYVRRIGKVFGAFDAYTNTIYVDQSTLRDKTLLRWTIFHEFAHCLQKALGKIYRWSRYALEREAHLIAEKLLRGYSPSYAYIR